MKLKARYSRKRYKSDDSFLNAVYRRNKDIIDEYLKGVGQGSGISTLRQFKFLVKEVKAEKKTSITHAMNVFTESHSFTPEELHFKENVVKGLRSFKMLNFLRKLTGKGMDIKDIKYVGDKSYEYRGYYIRFNNSPVSISIFDSMSPNAKSLTTKYNLKNKNVQNIF